jgi:hypothetical protein
MLDFTKPLGFNNNIIDNFISDYIKAEGELLAPDPDLETQRKTYIHSLIDHFFNENKRSLNVSIRNYEDDESVSYFQFSGDWGYRLQQLIELNRMCELSLDEDEFKSNSMDIINNKDKQCFINSLNSFGANL